MSFEAPAERGVPRAKPRVFLAGTDDVLDAMKMLNDTLEHDGFTPVWFHRHDFPLGEARNAMDKCIDAVRTCQYFILVIDKRAGLPYENGRTISEKEFETAEQLKLGILVFVRLRTWWESPVYYKLKKASNGNVEADVFAADTRVFEFIDRLQHYKSGEERIIPWITPFNDASDIIKVIRANWLRYDRQSFYRKYSDSLFWYKSAWAASVRLVGAAHEHFLPTDIKVRTVDDPYDFPFDWRAMRNTFIEKQKLQASEHGFVYEDGPNTRLARISMTVRQPDERKELKIEIGRVGWYDYSAAHNIVDYQLGRREGVDDLINLDQLVQTGDVRYSKLSNILDTATTIITSDHYVMYSHRGGRQSVDRDMLTSAIAENIHPDKDWAPIGQLGVPLPFAFNTVLRGVEEEASPLLRQLVEHEPWRLKLLGFGFNLDAFHPDALFLIELPITKEDVLQRCRGNPGKDFWEGKLDGVPLLGEGTEIAELLARPNWVPGGKSSVIRALQYVESCTTLHTLRS